MPSAQDIAKRELVKVLRELAAKYRVCRCPLLSGGLVGCSRLQVHSGSPDHVFKNVARLMQ